LGLVGSDGVSDSVPATCQSGVAGLDTVSFGQMGVDCRTVGTREKVAEQLEMATAHWIDGCDVRALRRALLNVLQRLEDANE
jgi:hypothetical protein